MRPGKRRVDPQGAGRREPISRGGERCGGPPGLKGGVSPGLAPPEPAGPLESELEAAADPSP